MPVCKSQVRRLMRIAALLKENRYPNAVTLMEEFRFEPTLYKLVQGAGW